MKLFRERPLTLRDLLCRGEGRGAPRLTRPTRGGG